MVEKKYNAVDLFAGCGGSSEGLKKAQFRIIAAIENDKWAVSCYEENHPGISIIDKNIRRVKVTYIKQLLAGQPLHLLVGCPPCQGFSSVRRLNKKTNIRDERNNLILEYIRFVKGLKPFTLMMENVPGIKNYYLFRKLIKTLKKLGYHIDHDIVDIKNYGVPQHRKRLILIASLLGKIYIKNGLDKSVTVRDAIGKLQSLRLTSDPLHKITTNHDKEILKMIKLIPKNGGSRKDLPKKYTLNCHKNKKIGFNDIYGRLSWDSQSGTITGGCLNPSKGRFLHPEEDRVITPREAALLQTFPKRYKFPIDIPKTKLASLIGNALPPKFSYIQSNNIREHLEEYLG